MQRYRLVNVKVGVGDMGFLSVYRAPRRPRRKILLLSMVLRQGLYRETQFVC
jgi:hypothetical protein